MTYSTGKVARLLNVSQHHIRRLCESSLIKGAELSDGNRWRIPTGEVDRLRAEGVPPIPQLEPEEEREEPEATPARPAGLVEPKPPARLDPVREVSPEVQEEADRFAVVKTKVQRRRTELELEEVEDAFRERERQRTAAAEEVQRKEAAARVQAARLSWEKEWKDYALRQVPSDASDCRLRVYQLAENALRAVSSDLSHHQVCRLVDDAVAEGLRPYRRAGDQRRAVADALGLLPYHARSGPAGVGARQSAVRAVERFDDFASMLVAARAAVEPIAAAFQDQEMRRGLCDLFLWGSLEGATDKDREEAKEAVQEALRRFPVGTPRERLEKAKEAALRPLEEALKERLDRKQRRLQAGADVERHLWLIGSYLSANIEFDSYTEERQTERELIDELRQVLVKRVMSGKLAQEDIPDYIEQWLDDWAEEDDEDD